MIQEKEAVDFKEDSLTGRDSGAEWHPYSVWRKNIHTEDGDNASEQAPQDIELTGSWKPLAVWQRQIKRA